MSGAAYRARQRTSCPLAWQRKPAAGSKAMAPPHAAQQNCRGQQGAAGAAVRHAGRRSRAALHMACARACMHAHRDRGAIDVDHRSLGGDSAAQQVAAGLGQQGRRGVAVVVACGAAVKSKGRQPAVWQRSSCTSSCAVHSSPVALQAVRLAGVIVVQSPTCGALLQEAALPRVARQAGAVLPARGARPPAAAAAVGCDPSARCRQAETHPGLPPLLHHHHHMLALRT